MPSVNLARLVLLEARRGALPWLAAGGRRDERLPRRVSFACRAHRKPHAAGGDRRRGAARLRRIPRRGARLRERAARDQRQGARAHAVAAAHALGALPRPLSRLCRVRPADRRCSSPCPCSAGRRRARSRGGACRLRSRRRWLRPPRSSSPCRSGSCCPRSRQAQGSICWRGPWRVSRPSPRVRTATNRSPTAWRAGRWTALRCFFRAWTRSTRTEWLLYGPPSTAAYIGALGGVALYGVLLLAAGLFDFHRRGA